MRELNDQHILSLYRQWSEEAYAANFMSPSPHSVESFRRWLDVRDRPTTVVEYESKMLAEYHRQEDWAEKDQESASRPKGDPEATQDGETPLNPDSRGSVQANGSRE